jgi:hypothetical protein
MADHNYLQAHEKGINLLGKLQEQSADNLNSAPAGPINKDIVSVLKARYETTSWRRATGHSSKLSDC